MKRQISGLHAADRCAADQVPDGVFLVRVQRVTFRRQQPKPYYTLALSIVQPLRFSSRILSGRLYCTPKALWKLNWFLRDFGYDAELLGRDCRSFQATWGLSRFAGETSSQRSAGAKPSNRRRDAWLNQFKQEVERELTGKETEPWEIVYFKLYKSQIPVIDRAVETAALMLGSDRSRGYCLEMICADFLAGANLDNGDPAILLCAMTRLFNVLPGGQKRAFLEGLTENVS